MLDIKYKPIGIIHSPFKVPKGTPIQPAGAKGVNGTVKIFPEYIEGFLDIEDFSYVILIYHFHLSKEWDLKVKPFMDDHFHGIFSTRAPARPNPIGFSVVRLTRVEEDTLYIQDVDIVDGTPLLDIKPYVPEFDTRDASKTGWLDKNVYKLPDTKDDERFIK